MGKIYTTPLSYKLLHTNSCMMYRKWFKTVEINGEENIRKDSALIFAANHQNGFCDAMSLLSASGSPIVFLAKAPLFKNKTIAKMLRYLKIMPAYRKKDGINNLSKNQQSFEEAEESLANHNFFALMPEGGQDEHRILRPLVKGIFRVGFTVQQKFSSDPQSKNETVTIVPTGIDYTNYDHSGGSLVISFGKPLKLRDYIADYNEDPAVASNHMRDTLYARMKALMLDVPSEKHYNEFYALCYIFNLDMLDKMPGYDDNATNRLAARQKIANMLCQMEKDEEMSQSIDDLCSLTRQWIVQNGEQIEEAALAKEYGTKPDGEYLFALLYAVCMSPLAAFAAAINWPVFALAKWTSLKFGKGEGFQASFHLAVNMLAYPIYHVLLALTVCLTLCETLHWTQLAAFSLALPFSYFFGYRYWWNLKFLWLRTKNILGRDHLTDQIADKLAQMEADWEKKSN